MSERGDRLYQAICRALDMGERSFLRHELGLLFPDPVPPPQTVPGCEYTKVEADCAKVHTEPVYRTAEEVVKALGYTNPYSIAEAMSVISRYRPESDAEEIVNFLSRAGVEIVCDSDGWYWCRTPERMWISGRSRIDTIRAAIKACEKGGAE